MEQWKECNNLCSTWLANRLSATSCFFLLISRPDIYVQYRYIQIYCIYSRSPDSASSNYCIGGRLRTCRTQWAPAMQHKIDQSTMKCWSRYRLKTCKKNRNSPALFLFLLHHIFKTSPLNALLILLSCHLVTFVQIYVMNVVSAKVVSYFVAAAEERYSAELFAPELLPNLYCRSSEADLHTWVFLKRPRQWWWLDSVCCVTSITRCHLQMHTMCGPLLSSSAINNLTTKMFSDLAWISFCSTVLQWTQNTKSQTQNTKVSINKNK